MADPDLIRPKDLTPRTSPVASEIVPVDNGSDVGGATLEAIVNAARPLASQAEAEAGVQATKAMTPLTTKQAIAAASVGFATAAQGAKADTALQSVSAGSNITVDDTDPLNPVISTSVGGGVYPATRSILKALNTTATTEAYLTEAGREGQFIWRTGDYSAEVAIDVGEGVYLKADTIAATAGAWVREYDGEFFAKWFGAKEDGTTDDRAAIQTAIDLCLSTTRPTPLVVTGLCWVETSLIVDRAVGSAAGANTFFVVGRGEFAGFTSPVSGSIFDSDLPYIGANFDTPSCNITFEGVTFLGQGNPGTFCVSDKFLKVRFNGCRFNSLCCVVASHYLQSWYFTGCSMIGWGGQFVSNAGPFFDCHWDNNDFEAGGPSGHGIKSFNDGTYGCSLTNNLFEGSGQFFSQGKGNGLVISGNYTEGNSSPDYQLSNAVDVGAHRGTVFTGNFMSGHLHSLHNVIVGDCEGMLAGGNNTDARLYDTTNTTPGSFKSNGDYAGISKFSTLGSFDADGAGDYVEAILPFVSSTGLGTNSAKTITSISLPAGDWDVSGVVGYTPATTTSVSGYNSGISLTPNALGVEGSTSISRFAAFVSGGFTVTYPTPVVRLSLAAPTTVYLVGMATFTTSTMTAYGSIRARKAGGR